MILVKNIEVYNPKYLGRKDIFISGGKINIVDEKIELNHPNIKIIDGTNKVLVPGFIDSHVHITGGGGEGSFKTRVPEITLSKLTEAGITTVVGLLGTDSTTRSVENLVAKAKGLKEEGISVYTLTGSYDYPAITITGNVKKDITFIEEIVGCKLAISDHREPNINVEDLAYLASQCRVAGMLSGKAGILVVHMGDGKEGLNPIINVVEKTEIPIKNIIPTHINRKRELLNEGFEYAKKGGIIDLTCGIYDELSPRNVVKEAKEKDIPLENITISSDGYGSWSKYDEYGNLLKIGVSSVDSLYCEFKSMIKEGMELSESLRFFTSNVAKALNIHLAKGCIQEGMDADLLILDNNFNIDTVIAMGKIMVSKGECIVKGTYE